MARDANALFDGSIKNIFGKKNYTPISASNYLIYDFFWYFNRNRKHRFSCKRDSLELKFWVSINAQ